MTKYDIAQTYDWNYANAPSHAPRIAIPPYPGQWSFCGLPVASPLGMPAGPLLNSAWIRHYAALGFDVLTYKTVRSSYRACYAPPNLLPVAAPILTDDAGEVRESQAAFDSWAISFGMPSKDPEVWMADVAAARAAIGPGQTLVVSVVASPEAGWTMDRIAADFAFCAVRAAEAGAHAVEANLSCPNVCTQEGDIYLAPEFAKRVAATVRNAIPDLPLILKIGLLPHRAAAEALIDSVYPAATALSSINSISARVRGASGGLLFDGLRRGIGGAAIRERCTAEMALLRDIVNERGYKLDLIGVGGIATHADVAQRLAAGASHVQLATAAMIDPLAAIAIRAAALRND